MRTNHFLILFILAFGLIALITGINVPFALLLLVTGFCYILSFYYDLKGFPVILFIVSFLIRLVYILVVNTPPTSDFEIMYQAALSFARGDYSFSFTQYFSEWAYQTGFVIYEGTVIKLFGEANALFILKLLNAVFSSATFVFVYFILKNYIRDKTSRFFALSGAFLIFPLTFVTVLSNQQLSTFLIAVGLFFFTEKTLTLKPWVRGLISGLFLALGNIIRPDGLIILVALFVFFLVRFFNPRQERRGAVLSMAVFLLATYLGLFLLAHQWIIQSGVNPQGLRNNNYLYKFVVGLNHETKGVYSEEDVKVIYGQNLTQDERRQLEWDLISQRLSKGPGRLLNLFISKQQLLWGGDPVVWSYQHLLDAGQPIEILGFTIPIERLAELLWRVHNLQMYLLLAMSVVGAVYLVKGPMNHYFIVFYLILLVSSVAFLVTEIQPRYVYLSQILLLITAAIGLEGTLQRLNQKPKVQGPVLPQ